MEQSRRSRRLHDSFQKNVMTQKTDNKKAEMGSKTPSNKGKQQANACDLCDLKFNTAQALRVHKKSQHSDVIMKRESSPESRSKATPKNTAVMSRASKRLRLKKGKTSDESDSEDVDEKKSKIAFSCPKCSKLFTIYFQALKHIQKRHCVDSDGNPVSPDSPDIIKPLTVDKKPCDNTVIMSHNSIDMELTPEQYNNALFCLGCDVQFKSVVMFNRHASFVHREDVDSMFFKTLEEFNMWKQIMETQVKIKYLSLKQKSSQKFYHCNYVSPSNEFDKTYICPSIIEVIELQTGLQIHYSKVHYGHTCPEYQLPEEFLQYLISTKDVKLETNQFDHLYVKLRELLENITEEAGKSSYSHLEQLYSSALKMKSLLSNEKEKDVKINNRSIHMYKYMNDDQITDALEGKRSSARLKRKSETVSVDPKKKKDNKSDDDSKSIKNEVRNSKENKIEMIPRSPMLSPTFNDTYKQFIGSPTDKLESKNPKRKDVVKTKMGQFSPKKKLSESIDKKPNILKPSKMNTVGKILKYEVREQENDCNILVLKI